MKPRKSRKRHPAGPKSRDERRRAVKGYPGIYRSWVETGPFPFEIYWRDEDGKARRRVLPVEFTLKQADALLQRIKVAVKAKREYRAKQRSAQGRWTIMELALEAIRRARGERLADSTINGYEVWLKVHIGPTLGDLTPLQLTTDRIAEFIRQLRQKGYAENTIADILKLLKRVVRLAGRLKLIRVNPFELLERAERARPPRSKHRILSISEAEALPPAVRAIYPDPDPSPEIAIGCGYFLGTRLEEALRLRVHHFDRDSLVIEIDSSKTNAGERRLHGLYDKFGFLAALRDRVERLQLREDDYLVHTVSGTRYDPSNFRHTYNRVVHRAGLEIDGRQRLTFHQLRHNFASIAGRCEDVGISTFLKQMGHAHPNSLAAYLGYFDEPPLEPKNMARLERVAVELCK